MNNNWYVLTGGPSTGKTTVLRRLKELGYVVVEEAARKVIAKGIKEGKDTKTIRADERAFQEQVFQYKLAIESNLDPEKVTFFDRGLHDTIAYLNAFDLHVPQEIISAVNNKRYKGVFLFEPLSNFDKDYARIEDEGVRSKLQASLLSTYLEYNMHPITIPPTSVNHRISLILKQINDI